MDLPAESRRKNLLVAFFNRAWVWRRSDGKLVFVGNVRLSRGARQAGGGVQTLLFDFFVDWFNWAIAYGMRNAVGARSARCAVIFDNDVFRRGVDLVADEGDDDLPRAGMELFRQKDIHL